MVMVNFFFIYFISTGRRKQNLTLHYKWLTQALLIWGHIKYHISSVKRWGFLLFQINLKNLDLSCKMDVDTVNSHYLDFDYPE